MVSRVKRYFLEIKDFSKTVDLKLPENFQIILDDKDNFHLNRFFYKKNRRRSLLERQITLV